jgi:hypothetical protein
MNRRRVVADAQESQAELWRLTREERESACEISVEQRRPSITVRVDGNPFIKESFPSLSEAAESAQVYRDELLRLGWRDADPPLSPRKRE